ncbi:hypothetical protein DEU56DRAFT_783476 [Suillus clintonianus]|uniref:uncharacterized protein n=1 Tax=Suillus clintonianus TaxID=1904413 RepID=UPI001B876D38|nr:uncharacterized protein DEU56DRAFT_783476 [Suillus clintonianus]KAG2147999.1 hypothetical protein DEU56DRAFT_783476 [Suillus clintonianus]
MLIRSAAYPSVNIIITRQLLTMTPTVVNMPLDIIHVPDATLQVENSGQPAVVYECKLQGTPCGMFVQGTTNAVSAHLRGHGITGPDSASISCTWNGCSMIITRGCMARHILTHLGVKVRCTVCGVVKCRRDILRAHMKSSEPCHFASVEVVHGPEGHALFPTGWTATHEVEGTEIMPML